MESYFAVIGNPIAHSLSPVMHQAGYRALNLEARYLKFKVEAERLFEAVLGLRALGFAGCNVTIPHKESILPYMDELTPEAKRIGAVNTIKFTSQKIIGHNTDGLGFVRSIQGKITEFAGKKAVILGAGGAARAIAFTLAGLGMEILILNIIPEMTSRLVSDIRAVGGDISGAEFKPGAWLQNTNLLVQATSVGLQGEKYPFELTGISPQTLVVDVIFGPKPTPFLENARALGCVALDGTGMLLHQGALAWEFWLGGRAPVAEMQAALLQAIESKQES
jgi:shikimate dehydrogenase